MEFINEPSVQFGFIAVVLAMSAILFLRWLGRRTEGVKSIQDPQLSRLLNSGNFEAAARYEQGRGNLEESLDLYLQAQRPAQAAIMAERLDQPRKAAELYERAKDYARAARCYREAGLKQRALEMEKLSPEESGAELRPGQAAGGAVLNNDLSPTQRVGDVESTFKEAMASAQGGDPEAIKRMEQAAREATEVLLSSGQMERAAEICAEAGLTDQAVNLYINLLGKPGEAAVLLARQGDHKRAAELFEAAGEKQRALASWLDCSFAADDPLEHLPEVEDRLGRKAAITMLDTIVHKRPPTRENIDLHYRIAGEYERRAESGPAITVLQQVDKIQPMYLDVQERLNRLRPGSPQIPLASWEREQGMVDAPGGLEANGLKLDMGGGMKDSDSHALLSQLEPHAWSPETIHGLDEEDAPATDLEVDFGEEGPGELDLDSLTPAQAPEAAAGGFDAGEPTPLKQASSAARRMGLVERDPTPVHFDPRANQPDLEELVHRAATRAAEEAVARARSQIIIMDGETVMPGAPGQGHGVTGRTRPMRLGIEEKIVTLRFARDHAVRQAIGGRDLDSLASLLEGEMPRQGNEELFFRLGLAKVNAGRWLEAREIFSAIHSVSPDYLDAGDRAQELGKWEQAVQHSMADQGDPGSKLLERYKLMGEIGRGGMAVVYRAKDLALEREVALKFLAESLTEKANMAELFQREAKAAAQLNHPNIVTIYDYGTLGGRAFICMELVGGETVEEILIRNGRMATLDALAIAEDILRALDYAHGQEIIHRDIKPSNIMRNERGECKLMDFGLAKSVSDGAKTTMVAGTPIYMAPEQFTGRNVDGRSDLFALGATLYEMITGEPPFASVARDRAPTSMLESCPKVPALLDKLVLRSMAFHSADRVQTAGDMLRPVQYILNTVRSYVRKKGVPANAPEPAGPARTAAATAQSRAVAEKTAAPKPRPGANRQATRIMGSGKTKKPGNTID